MPIEDLPPHVVVTEEFPEFFTVVAPSDNESGQWIVEAGVQVSVPIDTTQAQMREIAAWHDSRIRSEHGYHKLVIEFFHYPQLLRLRDPLGGWHHAPAGDSAQQNLTPMGDYSTHVVYDSIAEKNWELLPTQEEVEIYVAYQDAHDELVLEGIIPPSEDQILQRAVENLGMSELEVSAARDAVIAWSLDGRVELGGDDAEP